MATTRTTEQTDFLKDKERVEHFLKFFKKRMDAAEAKSRK